MCRNLPATTVHGIIDIYRFLEMVKEQVIPPNSLSSFEFNNVQSCSKIGDTFAYRKEFIINSLSHLSQASLDWIAHRSAHDKAEDIVKFVTDAAVNVIAFEAVIAKVGQACRFLTQGMGHARALELAENLLIHEPEIVPALEAGVGNFENLVPGDASEKLIHAFESDMEVVMSPCGKRIEKIRAKPAKQGKSNKNKI